jgi:hypothetical protein
VPLQKEKHKHWETNSQPQNIIVKKLQPSTSLLRELAETEDPNAQQEAFPTGRNITSLAQFNDTHLIIAYENGELVLFNVVKRMVTCVLTEAFDEHEFWKLKSGMKEKEAVVRRYCIPIVPSLPIGIVLEIQSWLRFGFLLQKACRLQKLSSDLLILQTPVLNSGIAAAV